MRVAINGFGRIGKLVLRAFIERNIKNIQIVAINELGSLDSSHHLLQYDSAHGKFALNFKKTKTGLKYNQNNIIFLSEKNPKKLPWKKMGIDVVLECSGIFASKEKSFSHIVSGAKKVLISAPAKDADITIVQGVNDNKLNSNHNIISNGSCTTNCLAPIAMALENNIGIESGFMTTIHSFTGDQRTVDQAHTDLRRARTASSSMIPTTTGAAKAIGLVIPSLIGKLDGTAIRVPTQNVSLIDLTFTSKKTTTVKKINQLMINESKKKKMQNILSVNNLPLVSIDFNHSPHSSIFDLTQTQVINKKFCRVLSWYDNEWGFSNRMVDTLINLKKYFK